MGMCMCTFVCPIGSCVGCGAAACLDIHSHQALKVAIFGTVLVAGCIFYVMLSVLCAKADQDQWTLFRGEGECWSEGGSMPYTNFGLQTGLLLGIGFVGVVIMACRIYYSNRPPHRGNATVPEALGAEQRHDVDDKAYVEMTIL